MHAGRMFPNMFGLHKRQQGQGTSDLPSSIGNPNTELPSSIGAPGIATDTAAIGTIVTADAPSGLTTIVETLTLAQTVPTPTTITTERTRTVTDALEYASITSAAAKPTSTRASSQSSSKSTSTATSTAEASHSSSSNLSTLIPAIVVPVVVVLIASLAMFWFFMRRRHRRELQSQPEFVMAGKGEKLNSRSSSARSTASNSWPAEKPSPAVAQKELPSAQSPPAREAEWKSPKIGAGLSYDTTPAAGQKSSGQSMSGRARGEPRPYQNSPGPSSAVRPATAGRGQPPMASDREQNRNRSNSTPGQRGLPPSSRSGPSPTPRSGPSPVPRGAQVPSSLNTKVQGIPNPYITGAPPPATAALRLRDPSPSMGHNTRAQAPPRIEAPGAYNGNSSISQYSPIVKDTPTSATPLSSNSNKRGPPPPLNTSNFASSKSPNSGSPTGLTEENMRIARLANSSRLGYSAGEPSPSPKLPPPATRSQLIPRESHKEAHDRFFAGSRTHSRDNSRQQRHSSKRESMISDADEYEDIDAKSDVSSLNEFERFDFSEAANSRTGSAAGNSLNFFAAQNSPASGRGSPFGNLTHERW